jgi:uncharacterized protein (TIGR01777 family)
MKIVVGGASGLIGSALVPAFRAQGHEVVRLVRRDPAAAGEIRWEPGAGVLDHRQLGAVDAIVNLSGESIGQRWTARRRREILESRVQATSLLARTAAELDPRPSVMVSASAIGVYPDRGDEILTEESEPDTGFQADVVRAWEAAADPAREAGVRVVSLRQSPILAKDGGALERMLLPFRLGVGGRLGSGKQWFSWVEIGDLTAAYSHVLSTDVDGVLNVSSPNPVTNEQFTRALGKALRRPTILPVPGFAIRTLFGEMGEEMLLEGKRVLPARLLDSGFEFSAPTIDVALERALAG